MNETTSKVRGQNGSRSVDPGQQAIEFIDGKRDSKGKLIERGLTHTGDFNGVPFDLRPWQESIVRRLFGTIRPDGKRQYRKAFLALPRKQGKTELAAAIILYLLLGTGRRGQQLYSASGDREQAALTYRAAAEMVRNDSELESVCLVYDGYKRIVCEPLGSFYQALSSDAPRKHGLRPSAVIFDELHVLPNRDLFNALTTAFGATIEPLTLMITTAGHDRTSLCYEQWKYAEGVRDGLIDDPGFLPVVHQAPHDADWTSEDVWHQAMPGLGDFCQLEFIRDECRRAQELPAYENTFRQLYLNQWTEQAVRWLLTERWAQCREVFSPSEMLGRSCYLGLDVGVTGDMAFAVLLFPDWGGGCHILGHGWAPREGKWRKEPKNRDRYEAWEREGFLTFTEGEAIDDNEIEASIVAWNARYPIRLALADRAYATALLNRLFNNHAINVKGLPQGPVTMNEPMKRLEEMILSGAIHHDNPVLDWNVANAVVRRNATGLMYLDKAQATERIDGLAALLDAIRGFMDDQPIIVHSGELIVI